MNVDPTIVHEVLEAEDIEGLLELGAPSDEYFQEAQWISQALKSLAGRVSEEDLVAIFKNVWNRSFGPLTERELNKRTPAFQQASSLILRKVV